MLTPAALTCHGMTDKTLKLWRRRDDGGVELKELRPSMFADQDSYQEAVDFAYERGFDDEYPKNDPSKTV